MTIDENTRLDLRRAFEELIGPELANAAMEAMPPLDYNQLATKTDVENSALVLRSGMTELGTDLRVEMADLRGEMAELRVDLKTEMADLRVDLKSDIARLDHRMATNLRTTVLTQFATTAAFAGFVVGLG